ncbi:MAG: hypothetical protein RMJ28_04545 [Nitrososphaerota archaeon]|nr:hypothetical protein [Candidatus Calditenuaceae archaeon]MDW8073488.1 hypothetical protein [Nitrososphaerota archaeon]
MNPPLIFSGLVVALTGTVLFAVGLQAFWILAAAGVLMVVAGFFTEKREEVVPENPGMKFCWYCMREIPVETEECMYCGLKQEQPRK